MPCYHLVFISSITHFNLFITLPNDKDKRNEFLKNVINNKEEYNDKVWIKFSGKEISSILSIITDYEVEILELQTRNNCFEVLLKCNASEENIQVMLYQLSKETLNFEILQ